MRPSQTDKPAPADDDDRQDNEAQKRPEEKDDTVASQPVRRRPWTAGIGLLIAALGVAALTWLAAENHYRGCVERAHALAGQNVMLSTPAVARGKGGTGFIVVTRTGQRSINACSRSPF
jgi:hypothetical protein